MARRTLLAGAAIAAFVLTQTSAFAENANIRLGYLLADSMLPAVYAQDKGYFAEAGLDVELILLKGGPAVVAAMAAGENDIGYSDFVPPINARIGGLPIKLFLTLSHKASGGKEGTFMVASKASGVTKLEDLKGKKISMNANGGLCELAWRDHLAEAGLAIVKPEMNITADDVQIVLDAMVHNGMQPGPLNSADFVEPLTY